MDDIRQLIRGYFFVPILAFCKKSEIVNPILSSGDRFHGQSFLKLGKHGAILLEYLVSLGFVQFDEVDMSYYVTPSGRKLYSSADSIFVPYSYRNLLHDLDVALSGDGEFDGLVDRVDNIAGSGATHQRYFIPVLGYLSRNKLLDSVLDIACGNGDFLCQAASKAGADFKGYGVDLSRSSIEICQTRFKGDSRLGFCRADGNDIEFWNQQMIRSRMCVPSLISMWFLLHELNGVGVCITDYLKRLRESFPSSSLLIGELLEPPFGSYAEYQTTVMPEYQFFHSLSNQKLFSKEFLESAIADAGFEISDYRGYDMLEHNVRKTPSIATWVIK